MTGGYAGKILRVNLTTKEISTIDTAKWTVLHILVNVSKDAAKELHIKKKLFKPIIINVSTDLVAVVGDVIQLRLTMKELDELF